MKTIQSVTELRDYGEIVIHLREQMNARGLSRNALCRLSNTRFEVVNKWYSGKVERIDTDILARFCFVLQCSVSDIVEYIEK